MQLTIALFDDRVVSVEIADAADLASLKAVLEAETGIAAAQQLLIHNGKVLAASASLTAQGITPGDLIMLEKAQQAPTSGAGPPGGALPGGADAQALLQHFRQSISPAQLAQLPAPLREALERGDAGAFARLVNEVQSARGEGFATREEEMRLRRMAEEDPFNIEVQQKLEEIIQKRNVEEQYNQAYDHNPELVVGGINMLYIDTEVNGIKVPAFVDSGAAMTIMSKQCAERCGLLRLLDTRFRGEARGVGKAPILGQIHIAPLKVAGKHLPIAIKVMEDDKMPFLFGLDNLRRHRCMIDLHANVLRFPELQVDLPFLAEHEAPKAFFSSSEDAEIAAPPQEGGPGPSAAAGGAPPPPAAMQQQPSPVPAPSDAAFEDKVQSLMALGFPRGECEGALRMANGNQELAASILFGGM